MEHDEPFAIFLASAYGFGANFGPIGIWVTEPCGEFTRLTHLPTPKNWCYVTIAG